MADDSAAEKVSSLVAAKPRKARALPPLSPSKRSKTTTSGQNRRKKCELEINYDDKVKSSESDDSTKLSHDISSVRSMDVKPSPGKVRPALPPRSPRKVPVTAYEIPEVTDSNSSRAGNDAEKNADQAEVRKDTQTIDMSGLISKQHSESVGSIESMRHSRESIKTRSRRKKLSKDNSDISGSQQRLMSSFQSSDTLDFDLTELEEDITELDNNTPPVISVSLVETVPTQSQHINKCFIEQKDVFKVVDKKAWMNAVQQNDAVKDAMNNPKPVRSALQLAQSSHNIFKTFTLFCHGLLAGISLLQVIVIYQLGNPQQTADDFLGHYTLISQPVQSLFSFLLAVCVVSVFDRYEFGRLNLHLLKDVLTLREGAFAVVIYSVTLILNLSISDVDDKFNLHQYNSTWWHSLESGHDIEASIRSWKTANLCRCIGATFGWMIISFYPHVDFLSRSLAALSKDSDEATKMRIATIT